jgi:phage anti-repressor protein
MAKAISEVNSLILTKSENYKLTQALYNIITDKTEKTSKSYKSNYQITVDSIKQLNSKF